MSDEFDPRQAREDREMLQAREKALVLIARAISVGATLSSGITDHPPYKLWVFTIRPPTSRHPVSLRALDMACEDTMRKFESVIEEWEFDLAERKKESILVKSAMDKLSPAELDALKKCLVESV